MSLDIRPVTPDLWPSLETLFGPQGACYGCWCSYFRLAPKQREMLSRDEKKQHLKQAVQAQVPPGLIALDDGVPVGWVQVTPRAHVPRWNTTRTVSRPLNGDDPSDPGYGPSPASSSSPNGAGRGSVTLWLMPPSPMQGTMVPASSRPAR